LDGSTPSLNSIFYTNSFVVELSCTIKAKAFKAGKNPSDISTSTITINKVATPVISSEQFWENDGTLKIYISISTPGATINYTLDDWITTNTYVSPFTINSSKTIKAFGVKTGSLNSDIITTNFIKPTVIASSPVIISTQFISLSTTNTNSCGDGDYQPYDRIIKIETTSDEWLLYSLDNWQTTNIIYTNFVYFTINTSITCQTKAISTNKLSSAIVITNYYRTILKMQKDVGWGNYICFTGDKPELTSWGTGIKGRWTDGNIWEWVSWNFTPSTTIEWKVRKNGVDWESGDNHLSYGGTISQPPFNGGF